MYKPKSRVHTEQNPKIPLIYNNIYGVILSEVEGSRQELRLDTLKTQFQDYYLLTILNSQPPHCVIPATIIHSLCHPSSCSRQTGDHVDFNLF